MLLRRDVLHRCVMMFAVVSVAALASSAQSGQRHALTVQASKSVRDNMIGVERTIAALLEKQATVASVAKTLGLIEGHSAVGFRIKPANSYLSEVLIGSSGSDASDAVPDYVRMEFDRSRPLHLEDFAGTCEAWRSVPNTPGASPFLYGCRAAASTAKISVNILITLSDDIHSSQAVVVGMTLQRGVW